MNIREKMCKTTGKERKELAKEATKVFLEQIEEETDKFIVEEHKTESPKTNTGSEYGERYQIRSSKYFKERGVQILYSFRIDVYDCPDEETAMRLIGK